MKNLSKRQQEVIDLLSEGWEIGWSNTFDGSVWIQKGGAGKGGESKKVHAATALSLRDMGLITCVKDSFPTSCYRLTHNAAVHSRDHDSKE